MAKAKRRTARRSSNGDFEFNPNSFNAQFASIHAKLKAQTDHFNGRLDIQDEKLDEIKNAGVATTAKVLKLENKYLWSMGWVAGVGAAAAIAAHFLLALWKH